MITGILVIASAANKVQPPKTTKRNMAMALDIISGLGLIIGGIFLSHNIPMLAIGAFQCLPLICVLALIAFAIKNRKSAAMATPMPPPPGNYTAFTADGTPIATLPQPPPYNSGAPMPYSGPIIRGREHLKPGEGSSPYPGPLRADLVEGGMPPPYAMPPGPGPNPTNSQLDAWRAQQAEAAKQRVAEAEKQERLRKAAEARQADYAQIADGSGNS